jgi:hypothetical protein
LRFIDKPKRARKSPPQRSLSWCLIWSDRGFIVVGYIGLEFVTTISFKNAGMRASPSNHSLAGSNNTGQSSSSLGAGD